MKTHALPKPIKSNDPVVILKHVIKAIRQEPKRYDQGTYIDRIDNTARDERQFPSCGTICCVAGWVNIVKGRTRLHYEEIGDSAKSILGLTFDESQKLFNGSPRGMRARGRIIKGRRVTPRQHASDGIKHIKRFVLKKWGKKI